MTIPELITLVLLVAIAGAVVVMIDRNNH